MNYTDLADDLLVAPIAVDSGRIVPPDAPGLGIEIDEEKLERYRTDRSPTSATSLPGS